MYIYIYIYIYIYTYIYIYIYIYIYNFCTGIILHMNKYEYAAIVVTVVIYVAGPEW